MRWVKFLRVLSYLKQPLFEFLNKSGFITDANGKKLGRVHKSDLNQTLKEGYLATAQVGSGNKFRDDTTNLVTVELLIC